MFGSLRHACVAGASSRLAPDEPMRRLRRVIYAEAERQRLLRGGLQAARVSPPFGGCMIRIAITAGAFDVNIGRAS